MRKYSRQREAVLQVLRGTDCHPTAAWIYAQTRQIMPGISLGTVYRNLNRLCEEGQILRLSVGDGTERFDGNPAPHLHFSCIRCGRTADVPLPAGFDPAELAARERGFRVTGHQLVLYGVCRACDPGGNDAKNKV